MILKTVNGMAFKSVIICYCYCSKLPQIWCLTQYKCIILKSGCQVPKMSLTGLKLRCPQVWINSRNCRTESTSGYFKIFQRWPVLLGLWPVLLSSEPALLPPLVFFPLTPFPLLRTLVIILS